MPDLITEVREALAKREAARTLMANTPTQSPMPTEWIGAGIYLGEFQAHAPGWLAALCGEVERLRDGIAELERQLNAEAMHAALGPDECCDVCTHRQAEDLIAEVDRLEAASAHEREITDKAIARAEKAEAGTDRMRLAVRLAIESQRELRMDTEEDEALRLRVLAHLQSALDGE